MKYVGFIVIHSILLSGQGFPVFSPSLYHYLGTGNIDEAVHKLSVHDCSLAMQHFIGKVRHCVLLLSCSGKLRHG